MPSNYYGVALQSTTASGVAAVGHSDAFSSQSIQYSNQRVRIVYTSNIIFTTNGTQIAFAANFTSSGVASVAQLL